MKCLKCQTKNPANAKFCMECAQDLKGSAETSPFDYSQPQSYTPKFLIDKILTTRSSIEGERKSVTVLFADVANFTSIAEKLDPEQVHQIMDGCFKILMDEIHQYEGTINQFTGDGVMSLFGAPVAHEDHAHRACLAAIGIQKALEGYGNELRTRQGIDFKMRIGLNSGPVVVGSIGDDLRMDYTAIGDTTNLAARMESMARPGTILLSENTYRIVSQSFKFRSLGKRSIKGKENPLEVFKLLDRSEFYRPRLGMERQIYSEMVGRDSELNILELQVMKAVNCEGSIVNIIGEAGIGKSRLVAELKNQSVIKKVALLEGRAISMGRNLSFHPIIDLLKHWARIKEDDSEAASFDKLRFSIRNICPEDTDEILPFVATLMGMKLLGKYAERVKGIEGEALEKLILKNVRDLLTKATDQTPLVIVTEDLHWADTSSIELLESLFRLAESQRIVFINVFRPDHQETSDRIVETIKEKFPARLTEILLQPLDERSSEALINNMLNITGLPHRIRQQIIERSGGNPFFIEEVVRSFIDEGAVVRKNGVYEVTEKIDTVVIPQTINDVLMARIDRLEEKTRDLIKVASVIGRNFFHRILTEVAKTIEDIDDRLVYLKEMQLIRERRRMEELEYLFKHALAQEAAYESILVEKRKELHLKVANSIERVFTEKLREFYGMLALHYSRGEDEEKAEEYLIKAGEEALKSSASSEALYYYQEALSLYIKKYGDDADAGKVAMLEKNIAFVLHHKGQYIEAVEYFDKVLAFYGKKPPKNSISLVLNFLIGFVDFLITLQLPFMRFKRIPTSRDNEIVKILIKRGEALGQTNPKKWFLESFHWTKKLTKLDLAKVENGIGWLATISAAFFYTGISFSFSRRVQNLAKDMINENDVKSVCLFETAESGHNLLAGNWSSVKQYNDHLVNQCLSTGEVYIPQAYLLWHGHLNLGRGRFIEVKRIIDKLSEIANIYESNQAKATHYFVSGSHLVICRRFDDALKAAEEATSYSDSVEFTFESSFKYMGKAALEILRNNDIYSAEDSLLRAKEHVAEFKMIPAFFGLFLRSQYIIDIHRLEISIKTGNKIESIRNKNIALKTGKMLVKTSKKAAPLRTESLGLMGSYYWLIGKQKKALKWWKKSIKEGERLGARPELSRSYMEVGKRLLEPMSKYKELNGISAIEYLEMARKMFEEMDLQWDLEELERIAISN